MITQSRIKELLEYKNGKLFWKKKYCRKIMVGQQAGYYDPFGNRRYIRIDRKLYTEHQIIWILHHDLIPAGYEIDHRDRNPANNLLSNLRLGTKSQNNCNKGLHPKNTSGYKGMCLDKRDNVWQAYINVGGKRISLKTHKTKEAAAIAYNKAARIHHGVFAVLNKIT